MEDRVRRTGILVFTLTLLCSLFFNLVALNEPVFWPEGSKRTQSYDGFEWIDERIYYSVGTAYIHEGLIKGRIEIFLANCWHPPLSKIITGLLTVVLFPMGLGSYPIPIRIHSSLMLAILAFVTLNLGTKLFGYRSGLIAVVLMLGQFFLQRGLTYLSQLTHAHWVLASINLTALISMSATIYFLYDFERRKNLWLTGVFYGLSMLSRFNAVPIMGFILLIWILSRSNSGRSAFKSILIAYLVGFAILFLGDPVFWRLDLFSKFLLMSKTDIGWGPEHSIFIWADFMDSLEHAPHLDFVIGEAMRLIVYLLVYPARLFQAMFLVPLFIVLLMIVSLRKKMLPCSYFLILVWLLTTFLFLDVFFKRDITYYPIDLIPALSLICAGLIKQVCNVRHTNN